MSDATRAEVFEAGLPEQATSPTRRTLAAHLNAALADELLRRPEMIVFGEDVGKKGGVYGLSAGLLGHYGFEGRFDGKAVEKTDGYLVSVMMRYFAAINPRSHAQLAVLYDMFGVNRFGGYTFSGAVSLEF